MLSLRKYDPAIHHRKSIRLRGYDYSRKGRYFVTLCCQGRESRFGKIENGIVILNDAGKMIEKWFNALPGKFPDISLGAFVIMPNHFHAIIINTGDHVGSPLPGPPLPGSPLPRVIQWFKTMTTNEYIRGVKNLGWERFDGK